MINPSEIFKQRAQTFHVSLHKLTTQSKRLSALRIISFIVFAIALIQLANRGLSNAVLGIAIIYIVAFIAMLKWHQKIKTKVVLTLASKGINEEELQRLEHKFSGLATGEEYYVAAHPYHEDLDVFGQHSIFQLINRSSTKDGKDRVAQWLSAPANEQTILQRQKAIAELQGLVEFRQSFQAIGRVHNEKEGDKASFIKWLSADYALRKKRLFQFTLLLFPALTLGAMLSNYLGYLALGWPLLMIVFNMIILAMAYQPLNQISKETENGYKSLGALKELILLLEQQHFQDSSLSELQKRMHQRSKTAAKTLSELKFLLDTIHNRANLMYVLFDMLFLLDIYWLLRIHEWKSKNKLELQQWFEVMAEFDALNSFAGYAFANPSHQFPKITNTPFFINAEQMGHPLIHKNHRINNNFVFQGQGGICLITGSNMSGKSTFLRTLGVNMILAQAGAPVCASEMQLSLTKIFTSMRTKDELEENVSSFYAELKRLKKLIESIDGEQPTLFMIDEVLKGTNSEDRHKGAIALIKQLNKSYAFGLVSTHDLVLGSLANQLTGVKNYSFNSEIKGDEINFDYQLTEGICKSFNATKLMQNMGIQIPEE